MTAPTTEIYTKEFWNPGASQPLRVPIAVLSNTSDEDLARNIAANTKLSLTWLYAADAHDRSAVIVGGGPSAADSLSEIAALQRAGATLFATNAASQWLRQNGIRADYQVICDAKPETATLVDVFAPAHLFASQCHPDTIAAVERPTLWHLAIDGVEAHFPPEKVKRGGYALVGGGAAVGNSAACVAYVMGHRTLHLFGYDSCHRDGESHAYRQAMNDFIPTIDVEWAGRKFTASVAMKAQAEKFQLTGQALQQAGCVLHVHGDGLLQTMWRSRGEDLTERDKYRTMWRFDAYREVSPGELLVDLFLNTAKPEGMVIDFGCGTGRAGVRLAASGLDVLLSDFADNCRDEEALGLPFIEWDLTKPFPGRANYGLCTDVLEHIPPADVEAVLANLFQATPRLFLSIGTIEDKCGALAEQELHLSVHPHAWWRERLEKLGRVAFEHDGLGQSIFYVVRSDVQ